MRVRRAASGNLRNSEQLEDVFTMNDFGFPLQMPNHPLYLNTEFNGHMFSTKRFDNITRVAEHVTRHARVHNQLASDDRYSGGIGWCAFDYNTHSNFGSGDHICYHGVSDIFRIPKPAAYVYQSQCDPDEEVVLQAGFFWSSGDKSEAGGVGNVPILSNCDHLKVFFAGKLKMELDPDRKTFPYLKHPPFMMNLSDLPLDPWGDLKIEGYLRGKLAKTLTLSGSGKDADLKVLAGRHRVGGRRTRCDARRPDGYRRIRQYQTIRDGRNRDDAYRTGRVDRRESVRPGRRHRRCLDQSEGDGGRSASHVQAPIPRHALSVDSY